MVIYIHKKYKPRSKPIPKAIALPLKGESHCSTAISNAHSALSSSSTALHHVLMPLA